MRRIWFKPDCKRWIPAKEKTTTFRLHRHDWLHEVDNGSRYKPKPSGLKLSLTPILHCSKETAIEHHYRTEGPFKSKEEFIAWLEKNRLKLPDFGWLHRIEVLEGAR